jgi:hypothetical protein
MMVGFVAICINLLCALCGEFDLTTENTEKIKRANRKAYDWPLNLEKLSRHKTSGAALVVALHRVAVTVLRI